MITDFVRENYGKTAKEITELYNARDKFTAEVYVKGANFNLHLMRRARLNVPEAIGLADAVFKAINARAAKSETMAYAAKSLETVGLDLASIPARLMIQSFTPDLTHDQIDTVINSAKSEENTTVDDVEIAIDGVAREIKAKPVIAIIEANKIKYARGADNLQDLISDYISGVVDVLPIVKAL